MQALAVRQKAGDQLTTHVHTAAGTGDQCIDLRDPYPFFAQKHGESDVFHGTVMDYSKTAESLRPKREYSAMSFNAVNMVFRDGRVFTSKTYDTTIGLFIGPTILAMDGKKHRDHRNLVSAAFKSKALARWEPTIVRPICNALIDEFINAGEADLVRNFTFEFPTRIIAQLLGLPDEDLPMFRKRAVQLISYTINYELAFPASAALKDYFLEQIEKRRSKPTGDIIGDLVTAEIEGESSVTKPSTPFCVCCCPPGWKPRIGPQETCCICC
jgi:cytochrome P450